MPTTTTTSKLNTGRYVAIATVIIGAAGAAVPALANMDFSSSAGIIAGLIAIAGVVVKYLDGWQKHEAREAGASTVDSTGATDAATSNDGGGLAQTTTPPGPGSNGPSGVTVLPGPGPSGPSGATVSLVDHEEPDAPAPGQPDSLELVPGDEVSDVPSPPTDQEIAEVAAELSDAQWPERHAA